MMGDFPKWDDFLEAKVAAKVSPDAPPQGAGAKSYYGAHAKNDGKVHLRVAEKSEGTPLGCQATPSLKDAKWNLPGGSKPDHKGLVKETRLSKDEPDGKVRLRVVEKPTDALGDKATASLKDPKKVHPAGEKPKKHGLTTEEFLEDTHDLSDAEFLQRMLEEGNWPDEDDDDDEADGPPKCHCAYSGKRIIPIASEMARYMAHMLPENGRALRTFLRELKATPDAMSALMAEMTGHSEMYDEMVNQMGDSEGKVCNRMVRAMQDNHEKFMEEMGYELTPHMGEAVQPPMTNRVGAQPQEPAADPAAGAAAAGSAVQPGSEAGAGAGMMQDIPPDGMGSVAQVPDQGTGAQQQDTPMAKLNKEFAYHHMLREMVNYNNMAEAMESILKG